MSETRILLSKGKIVLVFLGSLAFVAVSIWLWSTADSQTRYPPLFVKVVAVASGFIVAKAESSENISA